MIPSLFQRREHDGPLQHCDLLWTHPCANTHRQRSSRATLIFVKNCICICICIYATDRDHVGQQLIVFFCPCYLSQYFIFSSLQVQYQNLVNELIKNFIIFHEVNLNTHFFSNQYKLRWVCSLYTRICLTHEVVIVYLP